MIPSFVLAQSELFQPQIDISRSMQAWVEDVEEEGLLTDLPKGMTEGDLYEKAYNNAQYQLVKPALDALKEVHRSVAERCDGDLPYKEISNVFAEIDAGERYYTMLNRREIIDEIDKGDFTRSCEAVYKCYYKSPVGGVQYDVEDAAYSTQMYSMCLTIVDEYYQSLMLRTSSLQNIRDINYGDEFLSNAKAEDGPYDLLSDIEAIGNLMFSHNDPASEIHLYEMVSETDYVDNDPADATPYDVEQPNWDEGDPSRRLPPANGYTPLEPDFGDISSDPYPSDGPAKGIGVLDESGSSGSPNGNGAGSLQNQICEEPEPEDDASEDEILLQYAQEEYEQTKEYNEQLDLSDNVAIALLGKIAPELEEEYGFDFDEIDNPPGGEVDTAGQVAAVMGDIDLKDANTEELKSKFRACVENMVEGGDGNVFQKQVWKTITQPTRLTECIMQEACKELTDKSGRGLYRFRICKIPSKKYDVANYQPVYSVEEVVDEINNVCINLKESGQLIEHNKTKDHWEHKLMRVDFADKFSFGISVGFVPLRDEVDPAAVKRLEVQRNDYLEDVILDISDELTTLQERNKYLVLHNPAATMIMDMPADPETLEERLSQFEETNKGTTDTAKDKQSQLSHYGELLENVGEFVNQNTEFRKSTNDYTHSLNQKWQATFEEFKNDTGK